MCCFFTLLQHESKISLKNVGDVLKELLHDFYEPMYCDKPYKLYDAETILNPNREIIGERSKWKSTVERSKQLCENTIVLLDYFKVLKYNHKKYVVFKLLSISLKISTQADVDGVVKLFLFFISLSSSFILCY